MKRLRRSGYTLIEVLTAAIIVGVGMTAAVSMSSTMMMQEELSWRVAVAMNYQENSCRLWQLGLSPSEVTAVMPSTSGHPFLGEILDSTAVMTNLGYADHSTLGVMQGLSNKVQVANYAGADAGSNTEVKIYRPQTTGTAYEP
jgi:prepilin-type N-terminal cleavage/methylation domain-containing protein